MPSSQARKNRRALARQQEKLAAIAKADSRTIPRIGKEIAVKSYVKNEGKAQRKRLVGSQYYGNSWVRRNPRKEFSVLNYH